MVTIFFVDSENIGDEWTELLDYPNSALVVFYTENSPKMDYEHIIKLAKAPIEPVFIKCYPGRNGLDFQLVSCLGYELHVNPEREMVIVSKDTGYDAVVKFWKERKMHIKRSTPKSIKYGIQEKTESLEDVKEQEIEIREDNHILEETKELNKIKEKDKENNVEILSNASVDESRIEIEGVDNEQIFSIVNILGKENKSTINLMLTHIYGSNKGMKIYNILKEKKFDVPEKKWDKKTRFNKAMELIISEGNNLKLSVPNDFSEYVYKDLTKNKNSFKAKLDKAYGNKSTKLYRLIKPYYSILLKLKNN